MRVLKEKVKFEMESLEKQQKQFEGWVEKYTQSVFHMLRGLGFEQEQAREATQETFLQVWRSMKTFQERSSERTWILGIASNVGYKMLRTQRRFFSMKTSLQKENLVRQEELQHFPEKHLEQKRLHEFLKQSITQLSPKRRMVFALYHFEELSIEEIAQSLSMPEGTVRSNLQRARMQIQEVWSTQKQSTQDGLNHE